MRGAAVALLAVALTGCGPVNRIEVVAHDRDAVAARLDLCGRSARDMPKTAEGFELRLPADCRGAGRVTVTYADGAVVRCEIRLVAEDMAAWYRFQLADRACRIG